MTTTDRPRASLAGAGAGNLRRYVIALLATAYLVAWWSLGTGAPPGPGEAPAIGPTPAPPTAQGIGSAAWFHDLPAAARPVVEVPAGWHLADRATTSPAVIARPVPVPVRVPPARARRIRARSS